eukprot:jgi/Psemu1/57371/gm1.57371_g
MPAGTDGMISTGTFVITYKFNNNNNNNSILNINKKTTCKNMTAVHHFVSMVVTTFHNHVILQLILPRHLAKNASINNKDFKKSLIFESIPIEFGSSAQLLLNSSANAQLLKHAGGICRCWLMVIREFTMIF